MTQVCIRCNEEKPYTSFPKNYGRTPKNNQRKREAVCTPCRIKRKNELISSCPERYIKNLFVHLNNKRGKVQGFNIIVTLEELIGLYYKQDGKCALSNITMTYNKDGTGKDNEYAQTNISIDRINPSGNYQIENLQLICNQVNFIKHVLKQEDLLFWVKAIYEHNALFKMQ